MAKLNYIQEQREDFITTLKKFGIVNGKEGIDRNLLKWENNKTILYNILLNKLGNDTKLTWNFITDIELGIKINDYDVVYRKDALFTRFISGSDVDYFVNAYCELQETNVGALKKENNNLLRIFRWAMETICHIDHTKVLKIVNDYNITTYNELKKYLLETFNYKLCDFNKEKQFTVNDIYATIIDVGISDFKGILLDTAMEKLKKIIYLYTLYNVAYILYGTETIVAQDLRGYLKNILKDNYDKNNLSISIVPATQKCKIVLSLNPADYLCNFEYCGRNGIKATSADILSKSMFLSLNRLVDISSVNVNIYDADSNEKLYICDLFMNRNSFAIGNIQSLKMGDKQCYSEILQELDKKIAQMLYVWFNKNNKTNALVAIGCDVYNCLEYQGYYAGSGIPSRAPLHIYTYDPNDFIIYYNRIKIGAGVYNLIKGDSTIDYSSIKIEMSKPSIME